MRMVIDNEEVLVLNDTQKKVICNDLHADQFDADMKRRAAWVLKHKYEQCMERLEREWLPKLQGRVASVPLDRDQLAELIFSQPDYKDRKTKELEAEAEMAAREAALNP